MQISFDPLKYEDAGMDAEAAVKQAKKDRNAKYKELINQGEFVKRWTLTGQLRQYVSFGVPDGRVRNVYYLSIE